MQQGLKRNNTQSIWSVDLNFQQVQVSHIQEYKEITFKLTVCTGQCPDYIYTNNQAKDTKDGIISLIVGGILTLAFFFAFTRIVILIHILTSGLFLCQTSRLVDVLRMLPLDASLPMRVESLQISIALVQRLKALL